MLSSCRLTSPVKSPGCGGVSKSIAILPVMRKSSGSVIAWQDGILSTLNSLFCIGRAPAADAGASWHRRRNPAWRLLWPLVLASPWVFWSRPVWSLWAVRRRLHRGLGRDLTRCPGVGESVA